MNKNLVSVRKHIYGPRFSFKSVCQAGILSSLLNILFINELILILGSDVVNMQFTDEWVIYYCGNDLVQTIVKLNRFLKRL